MKKLIKKIINKLGYDLIKINPKIKQYNNHFKGLLKDKIVENPIIVLFQILFIDKLILVFLKFELSKIFSLHASKINIFMALFEASEIFENNSSAFCISYLISSSEFII